MATDPVSEQITETQLRFARKAVRWRTALAWLVVAILSIYYVIHPLSNVALAYAGEPIMMPLPELSWEDLLAILGGPVAGAWADRIKGDD